MHLNFRRIVLCLLSQGKTVEIAARTYYNCVDYPWHSAVDQIVRVNENDANLSIEMNDRQAGVAELQLYTCAAYEQLGDKSVRQMQEACNTYGAFDLGLGTNKVPQESCCICGGGMREEYFNQTDSSTNMTYTAEACIDEPGYANYLGHGCDWFSSDFFALYYRFIEEMPDTCVDVMVNAVVEFAKATDNCCVCGGGTYVQYAAPSAAPLPVAPIADPIITNSESCVDVKAWTSWFNFGDCSWFTVTKEEHLEDYEYDWAAVKMADNTIVDMTGNTTCEVFGNYGWRDGYQPSQACCVCGGGFDPGRIIYPEVDDSVTCLDVPGFSDLQGFGFTCDNFTSIVNDKDPFAEITCEEYGNVIGEYNLQPVQACCDCGGGYRGVNLARQFRVAYTGNYSDALFTLYRQEDGSVNGSLPNFLNFTAQISGFGMYEADISHSSQMSFPGRPDKQCVNDVVIGKLDFCIGPLWDVTVGYALRSETLFIDRFYLVVPFEKGTFFQLLLVPFVPFAVKTWLYIIFLIIYMVIVLNIIHTGGVLNEKGTIGSRVCNIMYHAANSFASGSATDTTDDPTTAEKVVIGGFAVAMLIILTAYTATSAAAIVLGDTAKFSNLADVVARPNSKLCILDLAYAPFLHQHPETISVLRKVNASTSFGMLQNMSFGFCKENDAYCCDAVVMHDDAYQTAVMYDVKYCEEMEMIYDEELLDIDNVIYISAKLHEYADSFIKRANLLIDAKTYDSTHSLYKQNLTGIAASIPSYEPFPGAVLHNSRCPKEEEDPGGNDFNLKPESIVFPLAVSALASTFGLLLYASQCHVWVAVKAKVGTELDDDDAHLALRANIEMMTPSKIIQELESSDVNRAQLSAAVNMLPDKSGLVDLMFQNSCSLYSINRGMVYSSLSVSDLYFLVKYCHASPDLTSIYVTDDMLDDDDVKDVLVQALMRYPRNRRLAITCARTKNEMGDELFSLFRFLGLEDDEITTESTNLIEGLNMEEITLSLSEMNRKKTNERIQGRSMISLDLENGSHYSGVQ